MQYFHLPIDVMPDFGTFTAFPLEKDSLHWNQSPDYWLMAISRCDGILNLNGMPYPFKADSVLIIPPNTHCRVDKTGDGDSTQYWSQFMPVPEAGYVVALPQITDLDGEMETWISNFKLGHARLMLTKANMRAFAWALLWRIAENAAVIPKNPMVLQVERFVEANLAEKIKLDELAKSCNLSHAHLIRLFRRELGVTPHDYIRDKRMQMACKLLLTTTMPIKEIAAKVGIADLQRFNKTIRETFGCSPRKLRHDRTTPDTHRRGVTGGPLPGALADDDYDDEAE